MPQVETPFQFGDTTLTAAEAASACGPAAAVAFARANGRNPTLREAVDLARRVGWTEQGGMNGVANQKRLLDAMGVSADLDTSGDTGRITRAARSGQMVTISTPIHYYVVDDYDPATDRLHVGNSGRARRGGGEWMTLEQISSRDGGVNGALYQTVTDTGGEMDRPPSTFEPPSRFGPGTTPPNSGPVTRADRMRARIGELKQAYQAKQAEVNALLRPGPDETPKTENERIDPRFEARADAARRNREAELSQRRQELGALQTSITQTETDLANDPDPKPTSPTDPVLAERHRVDLQSAQLALAEAQRKAAAATSPEEQRLQQLEVKKAELAIAQAELNLERTRNPPPPQRAPRYPDEIAQSEASAANSRASAERTTALLPGEVAKQEADLAGARQKLLPEQQRMLQGHLETVKYLQGMLERGEIDPSQADAYVRLSREATESGLRGTTPFQEAQDRRTGQRDRQKMGIDLLNQRMSTGGGLASSLLSAASSLANGAVFKPGQTSLGVDPLAQLLPLLAQLQGGEDVTPFARSLLMGGQQPAPSPAGALPAGL